MTTTDFMMYFIMAILGLILGKLAQEATEDYREKQRIIKDWEATKRKELEHE